MVNLEFLRINLILSLLNPLFNICYLNPQPVQTNIRLVVKDIILFATKFSEHEFQRGRGGGCTPKAICVVYRHVLKQQIFFIDAVAVSKENCYFEHGTEFPFFLLSSSLLILV